MDIKIEDLKAFKTLYSEGSFSQASSIIGISQSGLSQKIQRLEELLQSPVLIRSVKGITLTSTGQQLLRYANEAIQMQSNFLDNYNQYDENLRGVLRIAGFSSIMRSRVLKKLSPFLKKNPDVSVELSTYEVFELENILATSRADLIITDFKPDMRGVVQKKIGEEEFVVIESKTSDNTQNIFLDHGMFDNATESYFDFMGYQKTYSRRYMGDVYSIIDGVASGLGKAVMSKHLVDKDPRFKIQRSKKRYLRPLILTYFEQSYYSPLQSKVLEILSKV